MGPPAGRQTRWGKAGAPQRGGLPGVKRRVSTSQAEAAPAVGQHDLSGSCARRGSARVKRRRARRNGEIARKGQSAGYANCACTNRKTSSGFSATAVQASPSMLPGSAKPKP